MALEKKLYLIAVTLPVALNDKVHTIKQQIARDYHSKHALRLPAHITLQKPFNFVDESFLIKSLARFKINTPPSVLELEGFGAFAPRVIYIAVHQNTHLQNLYRELKNWLLTDTGFEPGWVSDKPFVPHVTVAYRDLSKADFTAAWARYKTEDFSGNFLVSTMDLWRHNGKYWQSLHEFYPYEA